MTSLEISSSTYKTKSQYATFLCQKTLIRNKAWYPFYGQAIIFVCDFWRHKIFIAAFIEKLQNKYKCPKTTCVHNGFL